MMKNMRRGVPNLFKGGTKTYSGHEAVVRNIKACKQLSDLTRTSLGPNGMNKMIVNHLNKLSVTSDCATIMSEMEIEHPAAKMIVMAAEMQEHEVGDGSNFVVALCGELLSQAEDLILMGMHPTEILTGYLKAGKKAIEFLEDLEIYKVDAKEMFNTAKVAQCIATAIASKQFGYELFLSKLVAEACVAVMPKKPEFFSVDNVRVVKLQGGSIEQSELVRGMVIDRDTEGTIKKVKDAKVAIFQGSIAPPDTGNFVRC